MKISNAKLDSYNYKGGIRIKFDTEYNNGQKSEGYVSYDKEGNITNHCSPVIYMNAGDYIDYYLEFADLCKRLRAFSPKVKSFIAQRNSVADKYNLLEQELKNNYDYDNLSKEEESLVDEIDSYKASLRRLKREDKIKDVTEKLKLAQSKLGTIRTKTNDYYLEFDKLEEERKNELKNIPIDL